MDKMITFEKTNIDGLLTIKLNPFNDNRGVFNKLFCSNTFSSILDEKTIKQINISETQNKGTIRGMHFQKPPFEETKIIKCLQGEVFDVAVDIRKDSKTFLKWFGINLNESNNKMILIPEGFAHGFQALSNNAKLLYMHTEQYSKEHEDGIRFDDKKININWKLEPINISERDINFKPL